MESRFGHDFAPVRIHAGRDAADSARALGARAYTAGSSIVFGHGQYAPTTRSGRELLAHELTHVLQQRAGHGPARAGVADRSHETESEATQLSATIAAGAPGRRVHGVAPALIQRQEETEAQPTASHPDWVMLNVPPVVQQQSLTCWAAALASWLEVLGAQKVSFQDIILRYAGTSCILPDNSLPYPTADEVYGEWGAVFTPFDKPAKLTGAKVRELLRTQGHLLFAQTGHALGHVLVVYGSGFDDKRQPNPDYISVMDPISGTHVNLPVSSLAFPVQVGRLVKRTRPAPCLSKAGQDPGD